MSRHRDQARIYLSKDEDSLEINMINEATRKMSINKQAENATDYKVANYGDKANKIDKN